jgi:hypothetical protein
MLTVNPQSFIMTATEHTLATPFLPPSSTSAETSVAQPPYIRYVLSTRNIPRAPPPEMANNFPIEQWHSFWSGMKPIIRSVELSNFLLMGATMIAFGVLLVLPIPTVKLVLRFRLNVTYVGAVCGVVAGLASMAILCGLAASYINARKYQLASFRRLCKEEEGLFQAHGYSIECDFQAYDMRRRFPYGFCLYFIPIQPDREIENGMATVEGGHCSGNVAGSNGYLRIETFHSRGLSWTPINLPLLRSFDPVAIGIASLQDGLWRSFWSELLDVLKSILMGVRLLFCLLVAFTVAAFAPVVVLTIDVRYYQPIFLYGPLLLVLPLAIYVTCLVQKRQRVVKRYTNDFASHGVYLEYRTLFEFESRLGIHEKQYLYLFPLSQQASSASPVSVRNV